MTHYQLVHKVTRAPVMERGVLQIFPTQEMAEARRTRNQSPDLLEVIPVEVTPQ